MIFPSLVNSINRSSDIAPIDKAYFNAKFVDSIIEDKSIPKKFSQKVENGYGFSHGPLLQKIIKSLQRGFIEPPISAKSALQTSRLVHALYKSDELQDWVKLKDRPISDRLGKELRNEN